MRLGIKRVANSRDIAPHARGGLVVHYHDRANLVCGIGRQRFGNPLDRRGLAPLGLEQLHVEPEPHGHIGPEMTELPVAGRQRLIARRQRIREGRFPAAGAGAGKDKALARFGLEDLLEYR